VTHADPGHRGPIQPNAVGHKGGNSRSYVDWSKDDLVKRAKEVGIKGRSTKKMAELVKALRHH
jgi:hypothetical protein